jgi:hypothetical protein
MDINFISSGGQKKGPTKNSDNEYEIVWSRPQAEKKQEITKERPLSRPAFEWRKKALDYWNSLKSALPKKKPQNALQLEPKKVPLKKNEEIVMKTAPKVEYVDVPHVNLINGKHKTPALKDPAITAKRVSPKSVGIKGLKEEKPVASPAIKPISASFHVEKPVAVKLAPHQAVLKQPEVKKPSVFWPNLRNRLVKFISLFSIKLKTKPPKAFDKRKEKVGSNNAFTQGKTVDNPDVLRANLITQEVSGFLKWVKELLLPALFVVVPLIIVLTAYISILSLSSRAESDLMVSTDKLAELENTASVLGKNSEPALAFREKIKNAGQLLDNHIYWTNFFDFLEKNTLKEVQYMGSFSGNLQGKFQFSARTNSLESVKEQVRVLRNNPLVVSANVQAVKTSASSDQESIFDFDLSFELKPEVWRR